MRLDNIRTAIEDAITASVQGIELPGIDGARQTEDCIVYLLSGRER